MSSELRSKKNLQEQKSILLRSQKTWFSDFWKKMLQTRLIWCPYEITLGHISGMLTTTETAVIDDLKIVHTLPPSSMSRQLQIRSLFH
jgi:hypothetical protein